MEIKMPAVFLCFDDIWISEWHESLPFLAANDMKATFYITNLEHYSEIEWKMILNLYTNGHTIGHHGLTHLRARPAIRQVGCDEFLKREIDSALHIFHMHGIDNIQHYSYPNGNGDENSDKCLFKRFATLRYGGCVLYSEKDLKTKRIFKSGNFGKRSNEQYCGHEGSVESAIKSKSAIFLYMHKPVSHRLEYLAGKDINFYPMSMLDR